MSLSQEALQGILASSTNVVYLECLTISHSDIGILRLVNNNENIIRNSNIFLAFPFTIIGPHQAADQAPSLDIDIDMVDQRVITELRSIAGKRERVKIVYDVIISTTPDNVEWGPVEFSMDSVVSDGLTSLKLKASFSLGLLNDAFPKLLFAPSNRIGL